MATETESNRGRYFVTSRLPWMAAAGMLVIYLFTLNRWLTPASLMRVGKITGWDWNPTLSQPLWFLVTMPFHWLPANIVPLALNLFSAVCGALTVGLLARTVALLPHDRTLEQRQREQSDFSILTIRSAWVPPVMAALVCGWQMTFWENAIDGTGEMFDLLLFAYVIRCLLEYRISENDSWLARFALVYGLGMAENWAMIGFFPAFLTALVWIMGLRFFNGRFLLRTALLGLAGFSLVLLLPVLVGIQYQQQTNFFKLVAIVFNSDKMLLFHAFPRPTLILLSLTSILPVFLLSIRWASQFGDTSPLGIFLATLTFHVMHLLFLLACIWVALDSHLSPRIMESKTTFLTFYYLGALSVGYFMGYFLLVFGTAPARSRQRPHPAVLWINRAVTGFIWALFLAVPLALLARNLPQLQRAKTVAGAVEKYCAEVQSALPEQPAVILSDDAFHLLYVEASLRRSGRDHGNLYIYTDPFSRDPYYLRYLVEQFPRFELSKIATNSPAGTQPGLYNAALWLDYLHQSHDLYYLQPSFGFFSEEFCRQPIGVIYRLAHYPSNQWGMPLPTEEQIRKNQAFWEHTANDLFPVLTNAIQASLKPVDPNPWQRFLISARLEERPDLSAVAMADFYSRAINYWGVELEKCRQLTNAQACFEQALKLNPGNVSARVNLQFNQDLRAGKQPGLHLLAGVEDQFGQHGSWDQILRTDGPFDEPNFRMQLGATFTLSRNFRQAEQENARASELLESAAPYVRQAQLFLYIPNIQYHNAPSLPMGQCYSNALVNANRALELEPTNAFALFFKAMACMQLEDFNTAIPVLTQVLAIQTNNYTVILDRAIANLRLDRLDQAKNDYEKVVGVYTNSYQAYYGLGEIAYRQKDVPTAIKNYELYLTNAPPLTHEYGAIQTRLQGLLSDAH